MYSLLINDLERASQLAEVLKAVAHPIRLRIIALLCEREFTVSEMVETLNVKQSIVSQQLAVLRMQGLVQSDRSGGTSTYTLIENGLKDLIGCLTRCRRNGET